MKNTINDYFKTIIDTSIKCFFSWFWKIKKSKDIERVNYLIDKLLINNIEIFKDKISYKNYKTYLLMLEKIKIKWKYRYIDFNISNI
jgi:hypothetical protein